MPSNYTQNYQLNQWEAEDRVQMDDFNADNAKIDAAIKAVNDRADALASQTELNEVRALATRSRFTKLKEFVSTESSSFLQIYLNDIDWAQWDKVHVDILAKNYGNYFFYDTDAPSANDHKGYITCGHYGTTWAPRMTFHVGFLADRVLDVSCGSNRQTFSMTYADVVKMAFSGAYMPAGARYVFWGET